jgi:hypothetical protein
VSPNAVSNDHEVEYYRSNDDKRVHEREKGSVDPDELVHGGKESSSVHFEDFFTIETREQSFDHINSPEWGNYSELPANPVGQQKGANRPHHSSCQLFTLVGNPEFARNNETKDPARHKIGPQNI